jgi:hypothetical protein
MFMGLGHLHGIMNWPDGLLFQRPRSAVPKLKLIKSRIVHGGGLTTTDPTSHSDGRLPRINESRPRVGQKAQEIALFFNRRPSQ